MDVAFREFRDHALTVPAADLPNGMAVLEMLTPAPIPTRSHRRFEPRSHGFGLGAVTLEQAYRASGLYLMRCGSVASAPSRRRLSSS